jgi:micrococcal nuclease
MEPVKYDYNAKVLRVVDGDTVWMTVDLGFRLSMVMDFRLLGINTPELVGSTKVAATAAKLELERILGLGSIRVLSTKSDKYGRWLGTFFVTPADGSPVINVNEALLKGGFAVAYNP